MVIKTGEGGLKAPETPNNGRFAEFIMGEYTYVPTSHWNIRPLKPPIMGGSQSLLWVNIPTYLLHTHSNLNSSFI